MLFRSILVIVSLLEFQCGLFGSCCEKNCTDKPVFNPSRLVVRHGDPSSATCTVCQNQCDMDVAGLEVSRGTTTENGTKLFWEVQKMTEWDMTFKCFYTTKANKQCCTELPVTVYQPPDSVSISYRNHSGPMIEGDLYTLQCTVQDVAPVGNLTVTFYRGQEALGPPQSVSKTEMMPVTEIFTMNISPRREDDGEDYWCKAELELGPEGPELPPVVKSQNLMATVHYLARTGQAQYSFSITEGDTVDLNCTVLGNPSPSYKWTLPPANPSLFNGSVLTISSAAHEHEGQYVCVASNRLDTFTVNFNVNVKEPLSSVSISYRNHSGPMIEGDLYTLQCTVQDVAPVGNLTVTFYRGQEALGPPQSVSKTEMMPVTEIFTLNISPRREDDGEDYWCKAELELGPEGPELPPVVKSQNLTATVHYLAQTGQAQYSFSITEGDTVDLNCTVLGNPSPSYKWTLPPANPSLFNGSVLTISSAAHEHEGQYVCVASNRLDTFTVNFNVSIKVNLVPIIAGLVASVVVLVIIAFFIYRGYKK